MGNSELPTFCQELQLLYGQVLQDVRERKHQQWQVAGSAVSLQVILGGVLSLFRHFGIVVGCNHQWILGLLSWGIALSALGIIIDLHLSASKARRRLVDLQETISNGNAAASGISDQSNKHTVRSYFAGDDPAHYGRRRYGIGVPLLLMLYVAIASGVLTWLIVELGNAGSR